eukprot:1162420-Lingulodinium_polyedra.AAC.1
MLRVELTGCRATPSLLHDAAREDFLRTHGHPNADLATEILLHALLRLHKTPVEALLLLPAECAACCDLPGVCPGGRREIRGEELLVQIRVN